MCVMWTTLHGSGTFHKEGLGFPGTGNLARDKHAGVTACVPLLKFQFHSEDIGLITLGLAFSVLAQTSGLHLEQCQNTTDKALVYLLLCTP